MKQTMEDLLAGEARLSLINEPPQPERREGESAREIARKRWRMIKREMRENEKGA